jgi:hypothetical protein
LIRLYSIDNYKSGKLFYGMRPYLEYAIRTGLFKRKLQIPFSLFLESVWDDMRHLVVTVHYDDKPDHLIFGYWQICEVDQYPAQTCSDQDLPPHFEISLHKDKFYSGVLVPDYNTLSYCYDEYEWDSVPEEEVEEWLIKEQDAYNSYVNDFFFAKPHKHHRDQILWYNFASGYLGSTYDNNLVHFSRREQEEVIKISNPKLWDKWLLWKKHFLDLRNPICPELVFAQDYKKLIEANIEYQDHLKKEEELLKCSREYESYM